MNKCKICGAEGKLVYLSGCRCSECVEDMAEVREMVATVTLKGSTPEVAHEIREDGWQRDSFYGEPDSVEIGRVRWWELVAVILWLAAVVAAAFVVVDLLLLTPKPE